MKKRLLKVAALLFAACGFVPQAYADSELLNADSRYSKVEGSMPENLGDYFFINTPKANHLIIRLEPGNEQDRDKLGYKTWWYRTSADPMTDLYRVWTIEPNNGANGHAVGYSFRNVAESSFLMQTENNAPHFFRTHDNGDGGSQWTQFLLAYDQASQSWTIENGRYPGNFVGVWQDNADPSDGAETAANKTGNLIEQFVFYKILKKDFAVAMIEQGVTDLTFMITGADCSTTKNGGWTLTGNVGVNSNQHWSGITNTYLEPCNWGAENWNCGISQTLTSLPDGVYKLTAAGRASLGSTISLFANEKTATFTSTEDVGGTIATDGTEWESVQAGVNAGKSFANGGQGRGWSYESVEVAVAGALDLGVVSNSKALHNWCSIDDFKLEYVRGLSTDELKPAKEAALAEIESAYQPIYDNSMDGEAKDEYGEAIETAETSINKATTSDEIEAALVTLEEARKAYVVEGVPNAGYTFDVTFLIADAAVSEAGAPAWTNGRTYDRGQYNGAPDNILLDINSEPRDIYQVINLRPGVYQLKAATRGRNDVPEGYIYINNIKAEIEKEGDQDNELGNGWNWTITSEAPVFGQAKIGFYANCNVKDMWASADDFKLYFVRELTEDDKTTVSLTVTEAGWATLMLPFDAELPSGLDAYTCADTEAGEEKGVANLVLTSAASLEANTPYIIQGAADTYEFKGYSTATQNQYTKGLLTGTYVQMPAVVGSYVLQNPAATGIGFYKVADVIPTVGAYRAYMNAETADAAGINVSRLILGGDDVTGIESALAGDGDARVDVYSLSGILVRKGVAKNEALNGLQKGIYVVDGVKKAVK